MGDSFYGGISFCLFILLMGFSTARILEWFVTPSSSGSHFVVPVQSELDLKKAAKAAGEKSVEMIKQKELLPLTGYIHGGCSPIGMKKAFTTFIHETAKDGEKIFVSAGKVGYQIELAPEDLLSAVRCTLADITV